MSSALPSGERRSRRAPLLSACLAATAAAAIGAAPAAAINYVPNAIGGTWGIHDAAAPGLDTGSVRDAIDNSLRGFGGIRVRVSGGLTPDPRLNGELMRGFGLRFDGLDRFDTTYAVNLGGLAIRRAIRVERTANWTRYLDTFTNTTARPIRAEIAFGGQTGTGAGTGLSRVVDSSSGDTTITGADAWAEVATVGDARRADVRAGRRPSSSAARRRSPAASARRELPAQPVGRGARAHRPRVELHRLPQQHHAAAGRDAYAHALRRHRRQRDVDDAARRARSGGRLADRGGQGDGAVAREPRRPSRT